MKLKRSFVETKHKQLIDDNVCRGGLSRIGNDAGQTGQRRRNE